MSGGEEKEKDNGFWYGKQIRRTTIKTNPITEL